MGYFVDCRCISIIKVAALMQIATKLRYDNFVEQFAANNWMRADVAVINAGFAESCAKQTAHRLITTDYCIEAIAKKKAAMAAEVGMTIERVKTMYKEDRDFATTVNQAGARVSATTGIARLYGMDKDAGGGERTVIIISPKVSKVIDSKEIER